MKKSTKLVLSGLLATLLTGMACVAEAAREVTVNNVDALMRYIGDDTTINLRPGVYNLSRWLEKNKNIPSFYGDFPPDSVRPQGVIRGYGGGVYLSQFNNLTLKKTADEGVAEIVVESGITDTLRFVNCKDIKLEGLTMGHAIEKGVCDAGVLGFSNTSNVSLINMDLYGCGAYGYTADNSSDIYMLGGIIRECSYGVVQASNSYNLHFDRVVFKDCSQYDLFDNYNSKMEFRNCKIDSLQGKFTGLRVATGTVGR